MDRAALIWSEQRATLGEGPFWDADRDRLLWVDIANGEVFATKEGGSTERLFSLPGRASMVVGRAGGGHLLAADTELIVIGSDGEVEKAIPIEDPESGRCLNDGACDASGRLWIGSAVLDGRPASAGVFRVDDGGCRRMVSGISMANGIGWSPDSAIMYAVDTLPPRRVDAFEFDLEGGSLGERRPFAEIDDGLPDGLAVDSDGCVWVAIWGAGEVRRFDPSGRIIDRLAVPVRQPSNCAFGGASGRDLYITTARGRPDGSESDEPQAGSIFVLDDAAEGAPVHVARF